MGCSPSPRAGKSLRGILRGHTPARRCYESPGLLPMAVTACAACSGSWDGSVRTDVVVLSCRRLCSAAGRKGRVSPGTRAHAVASGRTAGSTRACAHKPCGNSHVPKGAEALSATEGQAPAKPLCP